MSRDRPQIFDSAALLATEFLDIVLAASGGGFQVFDREWRWIYANDALAAMLGRRREDLLGRCIWEEFPEAVGNLFFREAHRAVKQRKILEFDHFYEHFGRWFRNRLYPFAGGLVNYAEDITDQRLAQQALIESEAKFRAVFDSSVVPLALWRADGRILEANDAYLGLIGYSREDLEAGRVLWAELTPPEYAHLDRQAIVELQRGQRVSTPFEKEYLTRDGRRIPVLVGGALLAGYQDRGVVFAIDLSERHRNEAELRRAKEAAEEANEAKDRFLATLSHELRTPLTPVLAVASALEGDGRIPPDARAALAMLRRNVELEARLIDDLLDLTRITHGKLELNLRTADLRQILEHALETTEAELLGKRLRLVTDFAAGELRLRADAPRLTQVFWNLLHNAFKFTPEGGNVALRCGREEGYLVVEVSDTGIGIEPEVLPRIFGAFEQASPAITRRFGGLGLGLALSRAIVELHGGSLTAASGGLERGATFIVRLPVGEPAGDQAGAPAAEEPAAESAGALHLLLVEDHPDTAEAMAELLRGLGYRVTVAGTVAAALAAARTVQEDGSSTSIDLVLSDLGLPDGTGFDLMRELAGRYGLKGIAISGYGMEEDVQRSHDAGFARHLTKPLSLQALDAAIRQTMG